MKGIGGHHRAYEGAKDEWLTPPGLVAALGPFNLDPCAPIDRPWNTAEEHYTRNEDGLSRKWYGRVWCNPPYGPETGRWLSRMADHGNGIALVFARTDTEMFHEQVFARANALLFIRSRLHFHHVDGTRAKLNAGGPSVLVAYGTENAERLMTCGIEGKYIEVSR